MKLIVVTTCDNLNNGRYLKLKASLEQFRYQYECIYHPFTFGTQLNVIRKWAESYTGDATHMLYTDAFDTLAFAGPEEVISKFCELKNHHAYETGTELKMLISAEKNCYPHSERAGDYPDPGTPWKYVNGGGWIAEIEYFKYLCGKENLNPSSHDQVWLMEAYLRNRDEIKLDSNCEIFQTIAFSHKEEWTLQDVIGTTGINPDNGKTILGSTGYRFYNNGTHTQPVFFHGNGHTDMDFVYKALE